jgi:transcriptional regulator with XRE-family HTH domain
VAEDATEYRVRLGEELRLLRQAAGMTQVSAAHRLDFSQPKVNKIETRTGAISNQDLERMLEVYRASPESRLHLRQLATQASGDRVRAEHLPPAAFMRMTAAERDATEILALHCERIPGPLQSEAYMLKQHESVDPVVLAMYLRRRRDRAQLFTVERPPRYRVILSESALVRMPGGKDASTVFDIATHLLGLTEKHPTLELQILPFDARVSFVDSDFVVLRFAAGSGQKDFMYLEHPGGATEKKDRKTLTACREEWGRCHAAALSLDDTRKFLAKAVEDNRRLLT